MKAIKSALEQDYPREDLEIILIDDASTDEETRRLVESYEHPRVKKILLSENVGVVKARNIGIEQAQGEYILPLDADDWFFSDYVRKAAQKLDANAQLSLVYGLGELTGDSAGQWLQPFSLEQVLLEGGTPACSMFRKSAWQEVGGYHDYMKNGWEDWDFWLSLIERGLQIDSLNNTLGFCYRTKKESRTEHAGKHGKELWENLYMRHQKLYQNHAEIFARAMYDAYHYRRLRYSMSYRIGKPLVRFLRVLRRPFRPIIYFFRRLKIRLN